MAPLYDEQRLSARVRMSLDLMLCGNLCGNMHGIVCGGGTSAMIGLANVLGAGDLAFGVLNGIPQAAALMQIPFSILVARTQKRKRYLLTFGLFSRVLWTLFGLIPIVMPMAPQSAQLWTLIALLGISSCCAASINVCWFPWFSDLAPVTMRARWMSVRDMLVAAANMLFGLFSAWLLQTLPVDIRYALVFALGGLLGVADMVCFGFCEERYTVPPARLHVAGVFKDAVKHEPFRRVTLMWLAWCFTSNIASPYMTRYSMNEMGLDFMQIMIFVTMAASVGTILSIRQWGRAIGTMGSCRVMLLGCVGTVVAQGAYLFSTPGNVIPPLIGNLFGAMFWSGSNLAANTLQLSSSPEEGKASYIAIFSCVTSLAGTALGTVFGGALLEAWSAGTFSFLGMDRYKTLLLLGMAARLAATLLLVPRLPKDDEH